MLNEKRGFGWLFNPRVWAYTFEESAPIHKKLRALGESADWTGAPTDLARRAKDHLYGPDTHNPEKT